MLFYVYYNVLRASYHEMTFAVILNNKAICSRNVV